MASADDPSTPSAAYTKMSPGWQMIDDILAGPETVRAAGARYLPKYGAETQAEYDRRRKCAPWQAEFEDILRSLAAKPFAKDVVIKEGASDAIIALAEDIDARGNSLTAFAREVFEAGIAKGCHGILVDNTGTGKARTIAEERAAKLRPYWVSIAAEQIIDLRTDFIGGREVVVHLRLSECAVVRDGYAEKTVERVREYNREPILDGADRTIGYGPTTWVLWEKQAAPGNAAAAWEPIDTGQLSPVTDIPLVMFWTGRRQGAQFVRPPLLALADKQIELYRALSRQDEVLTYAGSPMLSAAGVSPPAAGETVEVGPKRILYAPTGDGGGKGWSYVQPDAANIKEIRDGVAALRDDIRRLGMQPMTQHTGTATATEIAIEGARAHSAVQAWALALKDALEQAFVYTSQWLGEQPTAEVTIHTDFLAGLADQPSLDALTKARAAGDISRVAYLETLKRFGVLAPDFDIAADEEQLAEEMQGLEPEDHQGLRAISDEVA